MVIVSNQKFNVEFENLIGFGLQGFHRPWKVLKFEKCPGKSWKILGFLNFYEKPWKSPGILHSICPMNFLFQIVYNEFLPSCYVRRSTSFFLVYLPVSRIKI